MNLSEISDLFTWGTATAYTIAMIAFAIDLSQVTDAMVQRKTVRAQAPVLAVGDPERYGASSDTAVSEVVERRRGSKALGIAMSVTTIGFLLHAAAFTTRWVAAGRVPWANMYEFWLSGTFVAVGLFLVLQLKRDVRFLGIIVTFLSAVFLVVGLNSFHVIADDVQPALQNYWLVIHVGVAVLATGVFTVSFATSVLQLLRDSRDNGSTLLRGEGTVVRGKNVAAWRIMSWRFLDGIPTPSALEALSFRLNAVGFVLWTFTIIGGAIWAEDAWGRAWGWDPKEVWSFIIWVVYAAYLHARTTRGWSGRRAAYFVIVGYACVLFNFTGVNLLFNGKHSYSGI